MSVLQSTQNLGQIPETMLITLWAKAEEIKRPNPLLKDEKAVEILEQVDYDFTKFKKSVMSQVGVCIRASLIDKEANEFIKKNPDAVVIQLGAGLDARYERLGVPEVTHWYELDVPESIELRKRFFNESTHHTFLAMSLFDYRWIDIVKAHQKPVLIILEGVLMYFPKNEVKAFFQKVCQEFEEATVLFDMLAYVLVKQAKHHDTVSKVGDGNVPEFKWSELFTREMEKWNPKIHLEKEYYMSGYDQKRFPFIFRMLYKIPRFYRRFNQRIVRLRIS